MGFAKTKKVLIDAGKLKDLYSGLGQVSYSQGIALAQLAGDDMQLTFIVPPNQTGVFGSRVQYIQDNFFNRFLLRFTASSKFNLLHYPHQDFHNWLRPRGLPYTVTVHDLNFLYTKTEKKAKRYLHRLQSKLRHAKAIIAISNFTAAEIQEHVHINPIPLHIIYNGVKELNHESVVAETMDISSPFLFSIGVMHPKKNFEALLKMMTALPLYKLVIAGGGNHAYLSLLQKLAADLGVTERVVFTGYITTGQKKWLYENCSAFLFASVSEGFGLPVIEAMQFGKPVLLNYATSLPEIGGTYATYWHTNDAVMMAEVLKEGIKQFANKPAAADEMKIYAASFNWNKNAGEYLLLYQSILSGQPGGTNP